MVCQTHSEKAFKNKVWREPRRFCWLGGQFDLFSLPVFVPFLSPSFELEK